MPAFGLTLGGSSSVPVPAGYFAGTVALGDQTETVCMGAELWSPEDYLAHWKEAATAILDGDEPELFCSDYGPEGCTCFVAWREGLNAVFEEWVLRPAQVVVDGQTIRLVGEATRSADASRWPVPLIAIRTFAHQ
jgi:hypothetical protein